MIYIIIIVVIILFIVAIAGGVADSKQIDKEYENHTEHQARKDGIIWTLM